MAPREGAREGVDYVREEVDDITIIRLSWQLPLDDLLAVVEEVASLGVSNRRLWEVGDWSQYSSMEVRRIARLGRRLWPEPARVAYVAPERVSFGLLRMFEAYRDSPGYVTRAFSDEADALDWLRSSVS